MNPFEALQKAYLNVPAGDPPVEDVIAALPELYEAIDAVLDNASQYMAIADVIANAKAEDVILHVATRPTCAEHLEHGDDKPVAA